MASRVSSSSPSSAQALAIAKLELSGLTWDDAKSLGIEALESHQVTGRSATFESAPALYIPYYHPLTGQPYCPRPKWPAFYRLRYLAEKPGFDQLTGKKPQRYVNEPNAGVAAYFPLGTDWVALAEDTSQALIITEGELKAAKACVEGFPAIGLGGVYNFRSAKLGVSWLPELGLINWVKRRVFIIYDSDFQSNPQVCQALNTLSEELVDQGALPFMITLPDVNPEGKTGLDDYLISPEADLERLIKDTKVPLTLAQPLWDLNDDVIYVRDPGVIVERMTGKVRTAKDFESVFAPRRATNQKLGKDGAITMEQVSAANQWLKWPLRAEAGKLTYQPQPVGPCGRLVQDPSFHPALSCYNTWPGWGCEPAQGDVSPFLELLEHLFTGAEPGAMQWFLRWLAYPLQFPGVKLFTAVLFYGREHGSGKSIIGYTMSKIYGDNYTKIKTKNLNENHNEWMEHRQFILGDEITGSDKRELADEVKDMISQRTVRVNRKFIPSYDIPDCLNYFFTSNHPDAFLLEDSDRRFFIHEVTASPKPEWFYKMEYGLWVDSTNGPAALFDYLLKLDLGDFNPEAPAFRTAAKQAMIADGKSDLATWVSELRQFPDSVLRIGEVPLTADLFTNRFLLRLYDPDNRTRVTANGLGRELKRAGFKQACHGALLKGPDGHVDRYYATRRVEHWVDAAPSEAAAHLAAGAMTKVLTTKY